VLAGAALFEAALIPGIVIGGAVLLVPRYLPRFSRCLSPDPKPVAGPQRGPGAASPQQDEETRISLPAGLQIKQAVAETITFLIIACRRCGAAVSGTRFAVVEDGRTDDALLTRDHANPGFERLPAA
jgi:hypothetical protein